MKNRTKWIALVLVLVHLISLTACGKQPAGEQTGNPTETTAPTQTEPHVHEFVEGICACGETGPFAGITVFTDAGMEAVQRQDAEEGMILISANAAAESARIRLDKQVDLAFGGFYEMVYRLTSSVAGPVRFACDGAVVYEQDTYDLAAGENEIVVRFAAGQSAAAAGLELGALGPFELKVHSVECRQLREDMSAHFLDVAPEKASGSMETTAEGFLKLNFKTEEGWRVKLASDRSFEKGKTYETTYVFQKTSGQDQNVTYTVYDGAATILGSRTVWVTDELCVATFYLTANETVTKGTCLEIGMLSGGADASVTFTHIDFHEVDQQKLEKLLAQNPFPGVNVWTEGALKPATGTQSDEGLTLNNPNGATDWWKVKLEKELKGEKGSYYRVTFRFNSNAAGRIKFVNDDAVYYGSNEFDVKKGENTFVVELKSGGNSYSCLELGGLGKCELLFTEISVEQIDQPTKSQQSSGTQSSSKRFSSFNVWKDSSMKSVTRKDTKTTLTLTSKNDPTDWWKIKLEKDIKGKKGQWYALTYTFTSDTTGRIKFVNDNALYFGSNEYDVVEGDNTFTVIFQYGGKPYSCLELGGLGPFKLVFQNYSLKKVAEPEIVKNGFENFKTWTEGSMKALDREDTPDSMILVSDNEPGDWWKVKLENNFALEPGKIYEAVYSFTSDAEGDIKFGTNEKVSCLTGDVYHVVAGENRFAVTFTAQADAYTCLELGGLGKFVLTFTEITLTETEKPAEPDPEPDQPGEHTHKFENGKCECGQENGFAGVFTWTEGSLIPVTREDSENSMTVISANAPGDWWKVKVEWPLNVTEGKNYEATFRFTSDVAGMIKYSVNGAAFLDSQDYSVSVGENTFTVRFTAGAENYSCLELGGLGQFRLTFTEISLKKQEPAEHSHSFVNGKCECGETNGFAGVSTWTEGSLIPVTREDSESSMTLISDNAPGDWWKVKVEWPLTVTEGKTYEATFRFSSDVAGMIKYSVNGAAFLGSQDYSVSVGENTFTVRFTAGAENYSCLELGGLGNFKLTFTEISLKEIELTV